MACAHRDSASRLGWTTRTRFEDDCRRKGPAVPGSRPCERLIKLRAGIERYYGPTKENRYRMEANNSCTGMENVLIHAIEHDMAATLDILREHAPQRQMERCGGRETLNRLELLF